MHLRNRRLAAGLLVCVCAGLWACGPKNSQESTASAALQTEAQTQTPDSQAQETERQTESESTIASTVQIIGGSDGPTSVFVVGKSDLTTVDGAINYYIIQENQRDNPEDLTVAAYHLLSQQDNGAETICYVYFRCHSYGLNSDGTLDLEAGDALQGSGLARLRLRLNEDQKYILDNYWLPGDGQTDRIEKDVREQFPQEIQAEALTAEAMYSQELDDDCRRQAQEQADILSEIMHAQEEP